MPDRGRAWADTIQTAIIVNAGNMTPVNLLINAPTIDTLTAIRLIVDLTAFPDPALSAVDGTQLVHVGIGVSAVEAFNVGVTALPNPANDSDYPPRGWLYVASSPVHRAVGAGPVDIVRYGEWHVDMRAMRKIDKGILFFAVHNAAALGTSYSIAITGRVRVLCLT